MAFCTHGKHHRLEGTSKNLSEIHFIIKNFHNILLFYSFENTFERMNMDTTVAGIREITEECSQRIPSNSIVVGINSVMVTDRCKKSSLKNG